jgi:hypothetical protein
MPPDHSNQASAERKFVVRNFRVPKLIVDIDFAKQSYGAGESVEVTVQVTLLSSSNCQGELPITEFDAIHSLKRPNEAKVDFQAKELSHSEVPKLMELYSFPLRLRCHSMKLERQFSSFLSHKRFKLEMVSSPFAWKMAV